jgi:hypothetical protein
MLLGGGGDCGIGSGRERGIFKKEKIFCKKEIIRNMSKTDTRHI